MDQAAGGKHATQEWLDASAASSVHVESSGRRQSHMAEWSNHAGAKILAREMARLGNAQGKDSVAQQGQRKPKQPLPPEPVESCLPHEAPAAKAAPSGEKRGSSALQWLTEGVETTKEARSSAGGLHHSENSDTTLSGQGSDACCESNSESAGTEDAAPQQAGRAELNENEGATAGLALLGMLRKQGARGKAVNRGEPQPLSTDEFALWAMQEREDREMGADWANVETFGDDAGLRGWSFEENLAANQRLAQYGGEGGDSQQLRDAASREVERLRKALHESVRLAKVHPPCLNKVMHLVIASGWKHITWKCEYTALHLAAELGRQDVLPLLVALRADPEARDSKGRTAADVAKARGFDDVAVQLAHTKPLPAQQLAKSQDTVQDTLQEVGCLGLALMENVKLLHLEPECLKAAVLYTAASRSGVLSWHSQHTTCLHLAAELCRDDVMPLLVMLRADPDARDCSGLTALDVATSRQHWSSVWVMQKLMLGEGLGNQEDATVPEAEEVSLRGKRKPKGRAKHEEEKPPAAARRAAQGQGASGESSNAECEPESEPCSLHQGTKLPAGLADYDPFRQSEGVLAGVDA